MRFDAQHRKDLCGNMLIRGLIVGIAAALILVFVLSRFARADEVKMDMRRIMMIESSGNSLAHNKSDDSRGLYQITPIVLKEWNNFHPAEHLAPTDLWSPAANFKIADWYMNKRIPQMLRYFKLADTVENRIICYNAGIKTLVDRRPLPKITVAYLKKYGI